MIFTLIGCILCICVGFCMGVVVRDLTNPYAEIQFDGLIEDDPEYIQEPTSNVQKIHLTDEQCAELMRVIKQWEDENRNG